MEQFETKYIINQATYKELKWHLISTQDWISGALRIPFFVIIAVLGFEFRIVAILLAGIFLTAFLIIEILLVPKRVAQVNLQRAQESTGTTDLEVLTSFTNDGVKTFNFSTNGTATFNYNNFIRFAETKNMYILFTKASQFVVVNKKTLAQEGKTKEFRQFIRSKLPKIKGVA